jgi:hypothetical protein
MGVVYRAVDLRKKEAQDRDPSIAIKVLSDDFRSHPDSFRALQREARKAQTLAHPNIITVYDFDREDSLIYLTMEYLSGASLEKKIKANKAPLPLDQVLAIVKPVSAALSFAHENGIVHSDLKPANIFITDSGRVKVIDFGIARAVKRSDQQDTGETTVFDAGRLRALTPAYASIEMIEGLEPDIRDDVFALGCITYELIAGRHPYGRIMATEARAAGLVPKKPDSLNAKQWRALSSAINLDRAGRTPSVGRFIEEFLAPEDRPIFTPMRVGMGAGLAVFALLAIYVIAANPFRSSARAPSVQAATQSSSPDGAAAAAEQAAKLATERRSAEAARVERERQATEAGKREADRQAAEAAAKAEAERKAAADAAKLESGRQAAEAKKEADRQAAEAAKKEADRQSADAAAKKESDRNAAAEAAKKEAERQAAEAAAKRDADRKAAADTAKKQTPQRADATSGAGSDSSANQQTAALSLPRLNDTALIGAWCAGSIKIRLSPTDWRFQLADGTETKLAVTQYRVADNKLLVYSIDDRERESVTEFGNFAGDQMTQIRGRLVGADSWNSYNRVFKKC